MEQARNEQGKDRNMGKEHKTAQEQGPKDMEQNRKNMTRIDNNTTEKEQGTYTISTR